MRASEEECQDGLSLGGFIYAGGCWCRCLGLPLFFGRFFEISPADCHHSSHRLAYCWQGETAVASWGCDPCMGVGARFLY